MSKKQKYEITFFSAVVNGKIKYHDYIIPYIATALHHNKKSQAEILIQDPDAFNSDYNESLKILDKYFPDRYLLRAIPDYARDVLPNSIRFLTVPQLKSELTYIGDVDILVLDPDVADWHRKYMQKQGLPYSNNRRKGGHPMLTGLQCVQTEEYFGKINESYMQMFSFSLKKQGLAYKHHDEKLLYNIIQHRIGTLPEDVYSYKTRPTHGLHMSPNREPLGQPGWEITPAYAVAYLKLNETDLWKELRESFTAYYQNELQKLEKVLLPLQEYISLIKASGR